jgi:pyruvate/2-oxoglutarate dehydrogenase complex dihydrolipoamide dehydrogenase (E3) component
VPEAWDLIVIGGGAAGLGAARAGAAVGAQVLLVSEGEIGGECTFTGCVPSKALIEAAARGTAFPTAMAAVRRAVAAIAATETPEVLAADAIEVLRGRAVFTSAREVSVGGRGLRARGFVVATGSQPSVPPVPGLAGTGYLTNETIFDLGELPARLAVLGGGPVGCELAQAFARLSSQVTVIEAALRLLPAVDREASQVVEQVFRAEGISVRTAVAAAEVKQDEKGVVLTLSSGEQVTAERLLLTTGRRPVAGHLGLEAAGVRLDERGYIVTDRHRHVHRTARPGHPRLPHLVDGHPAGRCPVLRHVRRPHRALSRSRLAVRRCPHHGLPTSVSPSVVGGIPAGLTAE